MNCCGSTNVLSVILGSLIHLGHGKDTQDRIFTPADTILRSSPPFRYYIMNIAFVPSIWMINFCTDALRYM